MGFVRRVLTLMSLRRGGRALVARDTGTESRVWGATATTTPPADRLLDKPSMGLAARSVEEVARPPSSDA